ncbi:B12-binding domain-containing radical SAM protein [Paraliomyxa miuraensis]|uniref:B12-binding domain-containing radical SAM protein n=1 Tax=Paraliomyxa miuraensis TaxID=376150 RepID=UPI002253A3C5|nr:radical SAM protein [Paraliomyxa miuraensis]MCX4245609.1 B12-binding domain-containing radical SAM protein [Paraliomyxa miuraensis]
MSKRASLAESRALIEARLSHERGTLGLERAAPVCMVYPSPYRVGMSSLGFQTLYRQLNADGPGAHRAFLPDPWEPAALPWPQPRIPVLSYEALRPIADYPVLALSVAYELEVAGVIRVLEGAGIPVRASERRARDPVVIAGGPLTTTNPSALLPFVDVLIAGEGEELLPRAIDRVLGSGSREAGIEAAGSLPHTIKGEVAPEHFEPLPTMASVAKERLPAYSAITTPNTELADMFLVEPERGCSRRCTFCVMRGATTGGMRLLDIETPLGLVPEHAKRVGLVGAAVTDHPKLEQLVARVVDSGRGVGVSSLRADRLTPGLLDRLARGGYRQITVASDGISERLREVLHRKIHADDLRHAARLVAAHGGFRGLKAYQMIGAPTERSEDVDELIDFSLELASIVRLTLTFSTFVAKRNTPLDGQPFVGVKEANATLQRIRKGLRGKVEIRPQSPRWAHVEYLLAQRGPEAGLAALQAVHAGGRYRDWIRAFEAQPVRERPLVFGDEARRAQRKGKAALVDDRPLTLRVLD